MKNAAKDCRVAGSMRGSGMDKGGAGRLVPSPTAAPAGRRFTALSV